MSWFYRLLNEQIQKSLDEIQHQLTLKENELQSAQEEIEILEDKIGEWDCTVLLRKKGQII